MRREVLRDLLWATAADPRAALRWRLSRLRPLLQSPQGQALQADAKWVSLDPSQLAIDVLQVRALLEQHGKGVADARLLAMEQVLSAGLASDLTHMLGVR